MFLSWIDCARPVRLNDDNQRTRESFTAGPELELEWLESAGVVAIRRIIRPFGFQNDKLSKTDEATARAKSPRKVLALVPVTDCHMWPES